MGFTTSTVDSLQPSADLSPTHAHTLDLTVVIPTFNGSDRLPQVIDHLRKQQNLDGIRWEILIVDNNSGDRTPATVEALQLGWAQTSWGLRQVPLRYCFEPQQGLAFARQRAVDLALGQWIGFIDDDNWPAPDWVAQVHRFTQEHPDLAAFGSRIQAHYDFSLPTELHRLEGFLAIRDHGDRLYPFQPEALQLPPGAGLVVNRDRWLAAVPRQLGFTGRVGEQMVSGEDYAVLLHLHRKGGAIAYNPKQTIRHCIPARRFEPEALQRLAYGIGMATCKLRWINAHPLKRPWLMLQTLGGGLKRLGQTLDTKEPRAEIVQQFYLTLHLGTAASALYALSPWTMKLFPLERAQSLLRGMRSLHANLRTSTQQNPSEIQAAP